MAPVTRWAASRVKKYVTSAEERSMLLGARWRDDGIVFYVPATASADTRPVYTTLTNEAAYSARLYFVDGPEKAVRPSPMMAFDVLKAAGPETVPLMRVYYTNGCSHGHDELALLLNRAAVLALPSLLEGFGLPAVEAAACGCPVIATTASPLPDLLGDGGVFLDPADHAGWARELIAVLRSPERRTAMRTAGLAAAGRLTWDAAARQMLAVFDAVAPR